MLTAQVLAVKVGGVAVAVPPSAVVERSAVVLRVVVVPVFGGELHPVVLQQRVTYVGGKNKFECVSTYELKKLFRSSVPFTNMFLDPILETSN